MAVALFFPTIPTSSSTSILLADEDDEETPADIDIVHANLHRQLQSEDEDCQKPKAEESSPDSNGDESACQVAVEEEQDTAAKEGEPDVNLENELEPTRSINVEGMDLTNLVGRRVTLKPRRTLSLSPTPARTGDMTMARNLRAARWLDFTDKDDDDGLYQPSDSDTESKRKSIGSSDEIFSSNRFRIPRRTGSLSLGHLTGLARDFLPTRRNGSSIKRPLEPTLPCQEIQYLDISYQQVQFSPIARKRINYLPVPYHAIHYCDVNFSGERAVKRKPLTECV